MGKGTNFFDDELLLGTQVALVQPQFKPRRSRVCHAVFDFTHGISLGIFLQTTPSVHAILRPVGGLLQQLLAKKLNTSHSVIGRYERDEMTPSIEVAKKMAELLDTTVGYLLGEVNQADTFKDPVMLKKLQQINNLPDADKHCILYAIDNLLASATTRIAYGK